MNGKQRLLARFTPKELTSTFRALLDLYFDAQICPSAGCELNAADADDDGLEYVFATPELRAQYGHRFVVIGQATHTGSEYLLLRPETPRPVDEWAVVVSGDEGGVAVLAQSLPDWLRFLTLNAQPYVHEEWYHDTATNTFVDTGISFDLGIEEEDNTQDNAVYIAWLQEKLGLARLTSVEQAEADIIAPARQRYQAAVDRMIKGEKASERGSKL